MDRRTKCSVMIVLEIPAVVLSIVIFVYFALNRQARSKLKNHGWIILLSVNFFQLIVNLPMPMSFYYMNYVWPTTNAYCVWWTWCEFSLSAIGLSLMAWISIERHILIFHSHIILQGRWKKWLFHFLPLLFCLLWAPTFFFILVVISPLCTTQWDFNAALCGSPCYYSITFLNQFDYIFDLVCPILIILLANVTLVIRVIYQKISRHQLINWRRHRKMVLQLWIVSSLYMGFWLPLTIILFMQNTVSPLFMVDQTETMASIIYFVPLWLPMICLSTLPELIQKIMKIITGRRLNLIGVIADNQNTRQ